MEEHRAPCLRYSHFRPCFWKKKCNEDRSWPPPNVKNVFFWRLPLSKIKVVEEFTNNFPHNLHLLFLKIKPDLMGFIHTIFVDFLCWPHNWHWCIWHLWHGKNLPDTAPRRVRPLSHSAHHSALRDKERQVDMEIGGRGETGPRHSGDHDKLVSATTGLITTLW